MLRSQSKYECYLDQVFLGRLVSSKVDDGAPEDFGAWLTYRSLWIPLTL